MARRKKPPTKTPKADAEKAERADDYVNPFTGIGDWSQDKIFGGTPYGLDFAVRFLSARDIENRWRGSDLGGRLIEAIPDEMTRAGWELCIQPTEPGEYEKPRADAFGQPPQLPMIAEPPKAPKPIEPQQDEYQDVIEDIEGKLDELGAREAIIKALQYERAYGGAVVIVGADDGAANLAMPLDEENITDVRWLNVFSGGRDGEVLAWSYYRDPRSPNYGKPEVYQVRNNLMRMAPMAPGVPQGPAVDIPSVFYVHESRMLVFPGIAVSHRARVESHGWGDSLFMRVDEVLSQFSQTYGGIANLMTQFHQDVLKMNGLTQGLAGGNKSSKGNPLAARARAIQQTKSIARMLVIDSDEEFQRMTASLSGVHDVLEQFQIRLAAAADMPVDLLFSSMGGSALNKGDSTVRLFYDRIASKQQRMLLPQLKRLYKLIMKSAEGPAEGAEPAKWNIKFNPLTQLSELEQAQLRKTVAETDQIYINGGVLSPEEVAASAYGGSEWTMERTVDFQGRQQMAVENEKQKAEMQKQMAQAAKAQPEQPPAKPPFGK